jgi:hypothetical protein
MVDHLIFQRLLPIFIGSVIKDGLNWWRIPKSVMGFNHNFLLEWGHKKNSLLFYLFGTIC